MFRSLDPCHLMKNQSYCLFYIYSLLHYVYLGKWNFNIGLIYSVYSFHMCFECTFILELFITHFTFATTKKQQQAVKFFIKLMEIRSKLIDQSS